MRSQLVIELYSELVIAGCTWGALRNESLAKIARAVGIEHILVGRVRIDREKIQQRLTHRIDRQTIVGDVGYCCIDRSLSLSGRNGDVSNIYLIAFDDGGKAFYIKYLDVANFFPIFRSSASNRAATVKFALRKP